MSKNSTVRKIIVEDLEEKELESIATSYEKLNAECDLILEKIKKRRKLNKLK